MRPFTLNSRLGLPGPTPIVLFRESTVAGHFVSLAGVKGLAPYVHVTSGRLPGPARPRAARCCCCAAPARCRTRRACGSSRSGRARLARASSSATSWHDDNALEDRELAPALTARGVVSPPVAGAARRRRGDCGPDAGAGDSEHVPQLRVDVAARRGPAAALGDRRSRLRSERARAALSGDSIGYSVQAPGRGASGNRGVGPPLPGGGCCSSAARRPHCSLPSRCSRRGA